MGNAVSPCFKPRDQEDGNNVKVVFWGGATRVLTGTLPAGKLMVEFPDQLVCRANSFYIGHPVPALSIGDDLLAGETYFVIPADRLACHVLSAASIASLSSGGPKRKPISFGENPFVFVKDARGESLIKVSPEFITKILTGGQELQPKGGGGGDGFLLCSTPELQKHYDQLVGPRAQQWSPKLETISEQRKSRLSPMRLSPIRLLSIRLSPIRRNC